MKSKLLATLMAIGLAVTARAIPVSVFPGNHVQSGNQTSQSDINTAIAATLGGSVELYKDNAGGVEEGSLTGSYQTSYNADLSGGVISYTGGAIVGPIAYLLVKDGSATPAWYLFNLTALGWTGIENITMSGFWPDNGAISHVTLYGGGTSVPDGGATIALLGACMVALEGLRRKLRLH